MVDLRSDLGLREVLDNGRLVSYLVVSPAALDELVARYVELSGQQAAPADVMRRTLRAACDLANRGSITAAAYRQLLATAEEAARAARIELDLTELREGYRPPVTPAGCKPGPQELAARALRPTPTEGQRARAEVLRLKALLTPTEASNPSPEELAARAAEPPLGVLPAVSGLVAQLAAVLEPLSELDRLRAINSALNELTRRLAG